MGSKLALMKIWGKLEEVAKLAVCMVCSNLSFMIGNTIVIDCGTVLL